MARQMAGVAKSEQAEERGKAEEGGRGGLRLSGKVIARSRREFTQEDGSVRACITYRILAGIDMFHVDDWSGQVIFAIAAEVRDIPVYVRAFKGRSGEALARITVADHNGGGGFF